MDEQRIQDIRRAEGFVITDLKGFAVVIGPHDLDFFIRLANERLEDSIKVALTPGMGAWTYWIQYWADAKKKLEALKEAQ